MNSFIEWAYEPQDEWYQQAQKQFRSMGLDNKSREFEYPWTLRHGNFSTGQWVLDAGGGGIECLFQHIVASLGCHTVNVDWDAERLIVGNQSVLRTVADIRSIPFIDYSFDRIVCLSVLEQVEGSERALAQFWRLLKRGGRLLVTIGVVEKARLKNWVTPSNVASLVEPFGIEVPSLPSNALVCNIDGETLRVLCFYVDKN